MATPIPIAWAADGGIRLLDQTCLPLEERYLDIRSTEALAEAVEMLRVRGAPLIGVAVAMGVAQAAASADASARRAAIAAAIERLARTRPTAVNLAWALARMARVAEAADGSPEALRAEADAILAEEQAACAAIGRLGEPLIPAGAWVITVCNAGALATGGIGTALAPIYRAHAAGKAPRVIVPETRPLLQGSRLTAWELSRAGIEVQLISDNMVASRLRLGGVACALVGADRIAANGDTANKIGTYPLALACAAHGVPLYVAAPRSTVDPGTATGADIPIEQRAPGELFVLGGHRTAPDGIGAWNPAFDMTPARLITGIITPDGIVAPQDIVRGQP